jgi:hypothetical protein
MTPQETTLVTTLLERLKTTGGQLKDPDADTLIRQTTAEQPGAPYYLAQTVLIQDLSLHSAQNRIAEIEKNLAEAKTAASPPTSFLGGLLGTTQPATVPPPVAVAAQHGNPAPAVSTAGLVGGMGGGGFLRAAATTAAGVAGGALLFEGIQSMFGHHDAAGILGNQAPLSGLGETMLSSSDRDADFGGGGDPT